MNMKIERKRRHLTVIAILVFPIFLAGMVLGSGFQSIRYVNDTDTPLRIELPSAKGFIDLGPKSEIRKTGFIPQEFSVGVQVDQKKLSATCYSWAILPLVGNQVVTIGNRAGSAIDSYEISCVQE